MKFSRVSTLRFLTVFALIFLVLVASAPYALAKPRRTYVTEFLMDNLIEDEGFANCKREEYRDDSDDISYEATDYALKIRTI